MINNLLVLDLDRIYHVSDAVAYYLRRAAFHGREAIVAAHMGNADTAYYRAMLAANFAFASGFVHHEEK